MADWADDLLADDLLGDALLADESLERAVGGMSAYRAGRARRWARKPYTINGSGSRMNRQSPSITSDATDDSAAAASFDAASSDGPSSPHSLGNRIGRVAWAVVYAVAFRPSPRPAHRWRNVLLRLFGARLHPTARVYPRARVWAPWNLVMDAGACVADDVDVYCVETIRIGSHSTVSQYSYLCGATHDFEDVDHPLVPMPITIGRRVWVAADVFVAPGVSIPDGVVVGARSAVFSDLPAWSVCSGTPARFTRERKLGPGDFGLETGGPATRDAESTQPGGDDRQ